MPKRSFIYLGVLENLTACGVERRIEQSKQCYHCEFASRLEQVKSTCASFCERGAGVLHRKQPQLRCLLTLPYLRQSESQRPSVAAVSIFCRKSRSRFGCAHVNHNCVLGSAIVTHQSQLSFGLQFLQLALLLASQHNIRVCTHIMLCLYKCT